LVVNFNLLNGVEWSDGEPVTAVDSVFSYQVAEDLFPRIRSDLILHTQTYVALSDQTIEWRGLPGYKRSHYIDLLFTPLPEHIWGNLTAEELLSSEISSQKPIGWGPYTIQEWVVGDHMTLVKNPGYFRSDEGLPLFDRLVYRFMPDSNQALNALKVGECDLLDETAFPEMGRQDLAQLELDEDIKLVYRENIGWEHLLLNIAPLDASQTSLLQDAQVRQAIAMCIDRQEIVEAFYGEHSQVLDTFIPKAHPLYASEATTYAFDPSAGAAMLETAGWVDHDQDLDTPRQSSGVSGIPDGTLLEFDYLTLVGGTREAVAQSIQNSLAECGIGARLQPLTGEQLFAPGPDGPVFGRNFGMAQFAWATSFEPPCFLYTSKEIPGPYSEYPNGWGGANASGYGNPDFDLACRAASWSLNGTEEYLQAHRQAQLLFSQELPAIPLYTHYVVLASRPDFCALENSTYTENALWNIEQFDYGTSCP